MIRFNIIEKYPGNIPFVFPLKKTIKKMLKQVVRLERIKGKHIISFILVDNISIQSINRTYRKIDKPTDVISFANVDSYDDGSLPYELGDVFINLDRVSSQAEEYGHSLKREFVFLALHGTLHLLGYDHIEKEDEEEMFKRQDVILKAMKVERKLI